MTIQPELDFTAVVHTKENNRQSEGILDANYELFNAQCKKVLNALKTGRKLTVMEMMVEFGIGDPRRRIKDLRDKGIEIKDEIHDTRFKKYFIVHQNQPT